MTTETTTTEGARARNMRRTRERIVEAAMGLHTSVGPARTSVSAIAERAGPTLVCSPIAASTIRARVRRMLRARAPSVVVVSEVIAHKCTPNS